LNILNPYFKVNEESNIFSIRENELSSLTEKIREILKPAEELGFEVIDFCIKESKFTSGELFKTLKQNLVIKLQKGNSEIDLSMAIPKLIDRNYIMIKGRKKIPQFQLFDIPIVTRGKSIKLRTNVASIMVFEDRNQPHIKLSILGKKVSFALIMFAYYGLEELNTRFGFSDMTVSGNTALDKLMLDLKVYYDNSRDWTQDDFMNEIGRHYSQYNVKSKGEDLIYALDLILKTDVMSAEYFATGSILEELYEAIAGKVYDDTDFRNKRVRCAEYMILSKVSKAVFDLCMSNRTARQPKFNINSSQILSECNVSDIVQFDFAINPIEELTRLSRVSLIGPGGFNRENVPEHLRDICPSMFGRICPVDTPDRDNCGVIQNLLPNVKLDSNLRFSEEVLDKQVISIPVSMVPFLEHNDQTRLQMSASQMRQSIMLRNFDRPIIQSGCESLYTDFTQFVKRAKKDGEVVHQDGKFLIVKYDDNETEIFDIAYRKIYVENMDIMKVYVKVGDKFSAGEVLAESGFVTNGKINFGRNLLTAVMTYYGHNYEDGIVISDRLVNERIFTSVHYRDLSFTIPPNKVLLSLSNDDYKPLPDMMEDIDPGQPYAMMKEVTSGLDFYSVFEEQMPLTTRKKVRITDINVYANVWNEEIPEYRDWIEKKLEDQKQKESEFQKVIFDHLPAVEAKQFIRDRNLSKYSHIGRYKVKGEPVNGVRIEMFGVYLRPIEAGDKIANRHGNKGVISRIVPHEKMPQLPDGRHVDICINPLGIISRMNIGQLFELHLTMSFMDLKAKLIKMIEKEDNQKNLKKTLLRYVKTVDNTEGNWYYKQFEEQLPKIIDKDFIDKLSLIQPPFESVSIDMVKEAMGKTGTPFEYDIYDPISKEKLLNKIAVGYVYFFKMVHIAETRLAARGIGSYAKKTLQPLGGRKHRGGQRCGEMETACLIAHDGPVNLAEFLTTKSDCIDLKNRYINETIESEFIKPIEEEDYVSESVKLLDAYFNVIGVSKE